MNDLRGKKVLITGGSSGLGKASAKSLIENGANVLITGRNEAKLKRVADELNCQYLAFDMADVNTLEEKAMKAVDILGGMDVLINNAGIGEFALLGEIELESFHRVFQTNVFGLSMLTQFLLPELKNSKGDIVNIASTAAVKGFAHGSVYAGSKFALRGITQCWQAELRPHDIRVFLVNPSEVPTAFNVPDRQERELVDSKLSPDEIAHSILSMLKMHHRGFIPELTVWATNP